MKNIKKVILMEILESQISDLHKEISEKNMSGIECSYNQIHGTMTLLKEEPDEL